MDASRTTLIIGVGNRFRGDDGVGPLVADRLRGESLPDAEILDASGETTELMDLWQGRDLVLIADAAQSGAPAGTIHTVAVIGDVLPLDVFHASTHTFGLAQAVELARALDRLPQRMIIFGIEGRNFGHGEPLSARVADSVVEAAERIKSLVESQRGYARRQRGDTR